MATRFRPLSSTGATAIAQPVGMTAAITPGTENQRDNARRICAGLIVRFQERAKFTRTAELGTRNGRRSWK